MRTHYNRYSNHPMTNEEIAYFAPAIFAEGAHESRSDRYKYVPTVGILNGMRKAGFDVFAVQEAHVRTAGKAGFAKHLIRFRKSGAETLANAGGVCPEVLLINSHDGSSCYQLMAGMIRFACTNGLIVADEIFDTLKVRHSGNIEQNVIEGSYRVLEASETALAAPREWSHIMLNRDEKMAIAEAARVVRFAKPDDDGELQVETPITAEMLLRPHRSADTGADLWSTFNVLQENTLRGGLRAWQAPTPANRRGRMVSTREVNGIDQKVKLNKALWMLGERMAELKGMKMAA